MLCSFFLFSFTVLDTMRRSTGREGRNTGSEVTVFNSEGISHQRYSGGGTIRLPPLAAVLLRRVGAGRGFIHLNVERISKLHAPENKHTKGNTRSQCNPNKCSVAVAVTPTIRRRDPTPDGQEESLPRLSRHLSAICNIFRGAFQQNTEKNGVRTRSLVALVAMTRNNLTCGSIFHLFPKSKRL